jgi:hypothetical protein
MIEFFLVLGFFVLVTAAMSIGVIMGRKPLAGSCGGMAALGMKLDCEICGGDTRKCEEFEGGAERSGQAGGFTRVGR